MELDDLDERCAFGSIILRRILIYFEDLVGYRYLVGKIHSKFNFNLNKLTQKYYT